MTQYTLYSRSDCHLCDVMKQALIKLQNEYDFVFDEIDIEGNAKLVHEYGFFIPVLVKDGVKICHYELDESAFLTSLR